MPVFPTRLDTAGAAFRDNAAHLEGLIDQLRTLQARASLESAKAGPRFAKRGQLLPRERLALLVDAGAPFLELAALAGYLVNDTDPDKSVPGAGLIAGIGYISGTRCMIVVADSGIEAGALQPMGLEKFQRLQRIALEHRLPFVHLVESAGANLLQYRVEEFIHGGGHFYQLAKLSAAGIPVLTLVHGSSTAGGAYMPGLSDYVVMVRDRAKAFLAGPPLLKAATGEIATDEELGGALMHASTSGLAEYLAEDDADGIRLLRELVDKLDWRARETPLPVGPEPALDPRELLGILPRDGKKPADMREVIARLVDASDLLEFQPLYGPATVCAHARIHGLAVGIVTNNGPLDPAGATKATHFIQSCCQSGIPLVYLQNTTGFIVGRESERAGMIKHGAKMIQAVSNATVPQITILCGAAFGAGNYGMCGRGFNPAFLFSWPNARTAVMGAEQAALTMAIVMEGAARAKGLEPDAERIDALRGKIVANFERQTSAFYTSGRMLDDGVIDPRDTRRVIAMTLAVCRDGRLQSVQPLTFGVARP
ncbi:acyl-CoA carboxylase subunit beta [Burkholderia alba]|uniref:acyl-CoA carboxylase subunit beta n=1 Tax=Burkholderia alba TaxID=2683677 RepID=UPI002B05D814|nr:acyl-CoA carboxylase subunit beta [Burkholderia alba]